MVISIHYELAYTTSCRRFIIHSDFYFSGTGCLSFSSYNPAPLLHTHFLQPTIFFAWRKAVRHPVITSKTLYVGKRLSWNIVFQFLSD
jgi:hypothetical protein